MRRACPRWAAPMIDVNPQRPKDILSLNEALDLLAN
jgi:hypothetical protein